MCIHSLTNIAQWGAAQARIGLLEPISANDSLALAWAKASLMCELGASPVAIQAEIARVIAPHAVGAGDVDRYEFEDADQVSLQAMAFVLSERQARQLAQDVGLAAASVAEEPKLGAGEQGHDDLGGRLNKTARVIDGIGCLGSGSWHDPLASIRHDEPSIRAKIGAQFACERLRFARGLSLN
jgi:hypothetical protein